MRWSAWARGRTGGLARPATSPQQSQRPRRWLLRPGPAGRTSAPPWRSSRRRRTWRRRPAAGRPREPRGAPQRRRSSRGALAAHRASATGPCPAAARFRHCRGGCGGWAGALQRRRRARQASQEPPRARAPPSRRRAAAGGGHAAAPSGGEAPQPTRAHTRSGRAAFVDCARGTDWPRRPDPRPHPVATSPARYAARERTGTWATLHACHARGVMNADVDGKGAVRIATQKVCAAYCRPRGGSREPKRRNGAAFGGGKRSSAVLAPQKPQGSKP